MMFKHFIICVLLLSASTILHAQTLEIEVLVPDPSEISTYISDIQFDESGRLWVGNERGKLYFLENGNWTDVPFPGLGTTAIREIKIAPNNDLWLATNKGIYKYSNSIWTHFTMSNSNLIFDDFTQIEIDENGNVYASTFYGPAGLSFYDGIDWEVYTRENSELPNDMIREIAIDGNGTTLWFTAGKSVWTLTDTTWIEHKLAEIFTGNTEPYGLHVDEANKLWVGTQKGVVAYANNQWIDHRDISPTTLINLVRPVSASDIWMAGNYGGVYHYNGMAIVQYPGTDTIPGIPFDLETDSSGYAYVVGNTLHRVIKIKELLTATEHINKESGSQFKIYPQPAGSTLLLESQMDDITGLDYKLTDLSGKIIKTGTLTSSYDLSEFPPCTYVFHICIGPKILQSHKIIKH